MNPPTTTARARLLNAVAASCTRAFVDGVAGAAHRSRSSPTCRNSGSVVRLNARITGPTRRGSISHCRALGSQTPPAPRISSSYWRGHRTITRPTPEHDRTNARRYIHKRLLGLRIRGWCASSGSVHPSLSSSSVPRLPPFHYVPLVGPVFLASSSRCRADSARSRVSPSTHLC
jgi:hypothetical protein